MTLDSYPNNRVPVSTRLKAIGCKSFTGLNITLNKDGTFVLEGFTPETLAEPNITHALEVLMWVREQPEEFQRNVYASVERLFADWQNDQRWEWSIGTWLLLHANIPEVICRAVVAAAAKEEA